MLRSNARLTWRPVWLPAQPFSCMESATELLSEKAWVLRFAEAGRHREGRMNGEGPGVKGGGEGEHRKLNRMSMCCQRQRLNLIS